MPRFYRASKAPSQALYFLFVYDGQQHVGSIAERDDKTFVAYDADDQQLGVFKTMLLASRAIPVVAP